MRVGVRAGTLIQQGGQASGSLVVMLSRASPSSFLVGRPGSLRRKPGEGLPDLSTRRPPSCRELQPGHAFLALEPFPRPSLPDLRPAPTRARLRARARFRSQPQRHHQLQRQGTKTATGRATAPASGGHAGVHRPRRTTTRANSHPERGADGVGVESKDLRTCRNGGQEVECTVPRLRGETLRLARLRLARSG